MVPHVPGIKIAHRISPRPTEEELAFFEQMAVEYATIWTTIDDCRVEYLAETKRLLEARGIGLWNVGILDLHCDPTLTLGLPGRDRKIEQYQAYLRALGQAGIRYTTYAHMANGIWSSGREETRGGASARALDMDSPTARGRWRDKTYTLPMTNGREYSDDELWDNFQYFIRRAAPVAEAENVMIGIHPDDPPGLARIGGVPRLFSNLQNYQKALQIADSPNVGVCL